MAVKIFKSKKAFIFTIAAILLVAVLIGQLFIINKTTYKQKSNVAISRINSMNDFIGSVEEDITRSMFISGYRSLISMQKYLATNGSFVNISKVFSELFLYGSIEGIDQNLMENSSIINWADRIDDLAKNMNINVNLMPRNVYIYHTGPWDVNIEFNVTLNFTDTNNLASWYYNASFNKGIRIVGFEDPLYTIKSLDRVTNLIIIANNTDFVDDTTNDTSVLYNHLNMSYYIESTEGPSFLMRFEGDISNSTYGIESLVNLDDFSKQGLPTPSKSIVDYHYFNDSYDDSNDYCNYEDDGLPSWFRINQNRINQYELNGLGGPC